MRIVYILMSIHILLPAVIFKLDHLDHGGTKEVLMVANVAQIVAHSGQNLFDLFHLKYK
jgi:hypothetical protein